MFLRRDVLNMIKYGQDEYFDNDFIIYKEDIDLCWRLLRSGKRVTIVRSAIAYHVRYWGEGRTKRKDIQLSLRVNSFKNYYLLFIKNEKLLVLLLCSPIFLVSILLKSIYFIVYEREMLFSLKELAKMVPIILRKRNR